MPKCPLLTQLRLIIACVVYFRRALAVRRNPLGGKSQCRARHNRDDRQDREPAERRQQPCPPRSAANWQIKVIPICDFKLGSEHVRSIDRVGDNRVNSNQ